MSVGSTGDPAGAGVLPLRQLALPALARAVSREPAFAHPFERHFAALLDSYRIRWRYEPTSFLLSRWPDGTLAECFTPDFYLPDLHTYVELTSMRQALVTRKHGKLRRFRDAYPGIRVVMLYRRDYHRMLSTWGGIGQAAAQSLSGSDIPVTGRLLYPDQLVNGRLDELAWQIGRRYEAIDEEPLLIGLGAGGQRVVVDLAARLAALQMVTTIDGLVFDVWNGRTRFVRQTGVALSGRTATLVAPMVSTGLTTAFAAGWLRRRGTVGVEICALLDRSSARVVPVPLRYASLPAPIEHLVGYGLELRQQYRHLTHIAVLDEPYDGPLPGGSVGP